MLNLSSLLVSDGGRCHSVVVTWNAAEELDPVRLVEPFRSIVRILAQDG